MYVLRWFRMVPLIVDLAAYAAPNVQLTFVVESGRERVTGRDLRDHLRLESEHLFGSLARALVSQLLAVVVAARVHGAVVEQKYGVIDTAGHLLQTLALAEELVVCGRHDQLFFDAAQA